MREDNSPASLRRHLRALLAAISALALLTVGCNPSPPPSPASHPPGGQAVVTGGILPCAALPSPGGPRYAAGRVEVLTGQVSWRPISPGVQQAVFPEDVAARQSVTTNEPYRLVLSPGSYVLRARYANSLTYTAWKQVVLASGATVRADIPNLCF